MNNRIKQLSNESIIKLTLRSFQNLDNAMTQYGEQEENPYGFGGSLSGGWDMPTASMTFPRLYNRYRLLKNEGIERGIGSVKYTRTRNSKRVKKNPGKIIYTLAAEGHRTATPSRSMAKQRNIEVDFEDTLEREEGDIEVHVVATGDYEPADYEVGIMSGGVCGADVTATDEDGKVIELTDTERRALEEKALEKLNDKANEPDYGDY